MSRTSFTKKASSGGSWQRVLCTCAVVATAGGPTGCTGEVFGADGVPGATTTGGGPGVVIRPGEVPAPPPTGTQVQGLSNVVRRLTPREHINVVNDILGLPNAGAHELYPVPERTVDDGLFDNEWIFQEPSEALIVGVERLARDVAEAVIGDPTLRDRAVGCTPEGPGDSTCFESFIRSFGLRAFRRPVNEEDVQGFLGLHDFSIEGNDFYVGVELALSAFLQHPRFLYRIEVGQPVTGEPGLRRLDDYEVASRLSFFLWASAPDDALLQQAEQGELGTPDALREAARTMLSDPRARSTAQAYHEMWLGLEEFGVDAALETSMRTETSALIERVLFEEPAAWTHLFTADETFVSNALATHYGIPRPAASPGWAPYGDTGRRGILSHGSVLSHRVRASETDPVKRGLLVRRHLLCQVIAPPPESVIDEAMPPTPESDCKPARLAAHTTVPSCAGCHRLTDPIGFGLEQYDQDGRFRTHEEERPECATDGRGVLSAPDRGEFTGPGELGTLLAGTSEFQDCMLEQLVRFVSGRVELEDSEHDALVEELNQTLGTTPSYDEVVLSAVSHPSFVYRREGE